MALERTVATRGEVYLVQLDPMHGSKIHKTRPCLVVSPDELNHHLRTVIVTPMTTGGHTYPWRVRCRFQGRSGLVAIDQVRTVDTEHLVRLSRSASPWYPGVSASGPAGNVCSLSRAN